MLYKKSLSQRQEKRISEKLIGGRIQPGSGCGKNNKGDVKSKRFLVECKYTQKRQFILKLDELMKIEHEALVEGKTPLFQVDIAGRAYYVLPDYLFDELTVKG